MQLVIDAAHTPRPPGLRRGRRAGRPGPSAGRDGLRHRPGLAVRPAGRRRPERPRGRSPPTTRRRGWRPRRPAGGARRQRGPRPDDRPGPAGHLRLRLLSRGCSAGCRRRSSAARSHELLGDGHDEGPVTLRVRTTRTAASGGCAASCSRCATRPASVREIALRALRRDHRPWPARRRSPTARSCSAARSAAPRSASRSATSTAGCCGSTPRWPSCWAARSPSCSQMTVSDITHPDDLRTDDVNLAEARIGVGHPAPGGSSATCTPTATPCPSRCTRPACAPPTASPTAIVAHVLPRTADGD